MKLLESLPEDVKGSPEIVVAMAECHSLNQDDDKAIEILSKGDPKENPEVALCLANLQEDKDDKEEALRTLASTYMNHQRHAQLRYKLARLAMDLEHYEIALFLLDELSQEDTNSSDYLGYLGNCCLALNMADQAMRAYKRAEEVDPNTNKSWIIANIGNIYYAKGLPSEAIKHLSRSIDLHKSSDYAHDRLSRSIKLKDEDQKLMQRKKKEGLQKLRDMCREALSPPQI